MNWILRRFDDWFASAAGVWQTWVTSLAIVLVEMIWPGLDPNHFLVLYALTVYSGVTQPSLAYSGRLSAKNVERILAILDREENEELVYLRSIVKHFSISLEAECSTASTTSPATGSPTSPESTSSSGR